MKPAFKRVWRWEVGHYRVADSGGLFGWLRPLVEVPPFVTIVEMAVKHRASYAANSITSDNALLRHLRNRA